MPISIAYESSVDRFPILPLIIANSGLGTPSFLEITSPAKLLTSVSVLGLCYIGLCMFSLWRRVPALAYEL